MKYASTIPWIHETIPKYCFLHRFDLNHSDGLRSFRRKFSIFGIPKRINSVFRILIAKHSFHLGTSIKVNFGSLSFTKSFFQKVICRDEQLNKYSEHVYTSRIQDTVENSNHKENRMSSNTK